MLCSAAVLLAGVAKSDADLHITEFLASNTSTLNDEDGDASDWIELFNSGPGSASLDGYYLTDDPAALTKWQLPAETLAENGFLVVFASNKDRGVAGSELHTNFSLASAGEYLALVAPDGSTIVAEFGSALEPFPQQYEDISYGLMQPAGLTLGAPGYLATPSPGSFNGATYGGPVADTTFSIDRGFFDTAFDLAITTATAGAEIRYTLDGTTPSPTQGQIYSAPITINSTTVVRAMAHLGALPPTNVDTQTYLFLSDVVAQSRMDTAVTQDATYGPQMIDSLKAVPTISLVTHNPTNWLNETHSALVDPYVAASIEMIFPDGTKGFQENAGMKHFGGSSVNFHKKSVRLAFSSAFGATKLRYPLFDGTVEGDYPPTDSFDAIDLRSGHHDMQPNHGGNYMANRFADDTMLEMGHLAPHGRFVHVYLNGEYWGNYHMRERWNADMASSYFGGPKEDYDAVNLNNNFQDEEEVYDGDGVFWAATKAHVAGADPWDGIDTYVDVPNLIDFMLLWHAGWCENEVRLFGSAAQGQPFRFMEKDADGWFRGLRVAPDPGAPKYHNLGEGSPIGKDPDRDLMQRLKLGSGHADFPMLVADRIHKHFFNDGALTPARNIARLQRRVDERKLAMLSESARWGARAPYGYRDHDDWLVDTEDWAIDRFAGNSPATITHTQTVINRFKSGSFNMYPSIDAPEFLVNGSLQHGGSIPQGGTLSLTSGSGTIYYTTDGSDPRLDGGDVNLVDASAISSGRTVALPASGLVRARLKSGGVWSALTEASFTIDTVPADSSNLVVSEFHYHPANPTTPAELAISADRDDYEFLELQNIGGQAISLGGVGFATGINFDFPELAVLAAGERLLLVRNRAAFEARYGVAPVQCYEYTGRLGNDGELVTLVNEGPTPTTIQSFTYNDQLPWPPAADGLGPSLTLLAPDSAPDHNDAASWAASVPTPGLGGIDYASWQIANFGPGSPTGSGPTEDFNGDGIPNLIAFALGISPLVYEPAGLPVIDVQGDVATFTFVQDTTLTGISCEVQVSSDLDEWDPLADVPIGSSGFLETRQASTLIGADPRIFFRLRVTQL